MNAGRHKRMILFLLAGSAAVILAAAFSVLYGSTGIPANQVFGAIVHPDMETGSILSYGNFASRVRLDVCWWAPLFLQRAPSCRE